jgi:hypothetical protein
MSRSPFYAFLLIAFLLTACGEIHKEARYPTGADRASTGGDIYAQPQSIFGSGGMFGRSKQKDEDSGIGVNSYLWRASLDTVSFMPLNSADPFGGTILTDWYSSPESPKERYKVNVFILGKQLRSDGVRVRVFKQLQGKKGGWNDADVAPETARQLEDTILTRARQLRVAQMK